MTAKGPIAAKTMIYLAYRSCGCAAAALVARPGEETETAKILASWMKLGFTMQSREIETTLHLAPYCMNETPLFAPKDADDLDRTPIRITTADGRSAETDLETMSRAVDMIRSGRIRLGQDADETDDAGPPMALAGVTYAPLDEILPTVAKPDPGLIEALEALGINNDDNARTAQAYMDRKAEEATRNCQ